MRQLQETVPLLVRNLPFVINIRTLLQPLKSCRLRLEMEYIFFLVELNGIPSTEAFSVSIIIEAVDNRCWVDSEIDHDRCMEKNPHRHLHQYKVTHIHAQFPCERAYDSAPSSWQLV